MSKRKKELTKPQLRALVALHLLSQQSKADCFSRWQIGQVAKHDCSSFPIKTMRALWSRGLVEPLEDLAVTLVESGRCRCGCDVWRITADGTAEAAKHKTVGRRPKTSLGMSDADRARLWGLGDDVQDRWWRDGNPPDFDPNSDSQRGGD